MDIKSVPQDNSSTYGEMKKAIYASSSDGKIKSIGSTGWDAEEIVTQQAIDDLEESRKEALKKVIAKERSPLYYYMYEVRMDLTVLSQSTGFFKWTIKRDFNPKIFDKISKKRLLVYCEALGKSLEEIKKIPKDINE